MRFSPPSPHPHLQVRHRRPDIACGTCGDHAGGRDGDVPPLCEESRESLVFRGLDGLRIADCGLWIAVRWATPGTRIPIRTLAADWDEPRPLRRTEGAWFLQSEIRNPQSEIGSVSVQQNPTRQRGRVESMMGHHVIHHRAIHRHHCEIRPLRPHPLHRAIQAGGACGV
jgi:hypothetical protein